MKVHRESFTVDSVGHRVSFHTVTQQVKDILEVNKQERHLRGGEATRKKYHQMLQAE